MSLSTPRKIDQLKTTRSRPMKVLVLGMSRTGTMGIYEALHQLGYKSYHFKEAIENPVRDLGIWEEALRAKFLGIGKPYGRKEFDKLLGDYDAVADLPCAFFVDELTKAYPEAQVVLTNRDVDKWLASMNTTVLEAWSWKSWGIICPCELKYQFPNYVDSWDFLFAGASRDGEQYGSFCISSRDRVLCVF